MIHKVLLSFLILLVSCAPTRTSKSQKLPIVKAEHVHGQQKVKKPEVKVKQLKTVRIGLRYDADKVSIHCEGPFVVKNISTKANQKWAPGKYLLTVKGGQLHLKGKKIGKKVRFVPTSDSYPVKSNQKSYRGSLMALVSKSSRVNLINELSVDDYLKGVLPREVVVSWPEESLKAQAVASRTYMASHMGRHTKDGFDLCSDVHCQVYGGRDREDSRTNKAVNTTRGEILVHDGKAIGAFFHANCGGQTEKILPVWGSPNKPYLPSVKCSYGRAAARYVWSLTVSNKDMLRLLKEKTNVKGKKLKKFSVAKKSGSGRAAYVSIQTDRGTFKISGNAFRLALHPEKIRSTLWSRVTKTSGGYRFEGTGWGHGVGMCQWGAKGMSELGRSYKDVLKYFYPNTSIKVWTS